MTTVNDFVDILRVIREQPEWGEALRSALPSKEVLELPQRLAEFWKAANRRFDRLEENVSELKEGQAQLEGQVGNLRGNSYEQRIGDTISSIMNDRMNIRVRTLKGANLDDDSEFFDLLHDAEGQGVIGHQERSDFAYADIVLQERGRPDAAARYIVVEVSTAVADHDVIRSTERAAIMQRPTDGKALPVVVGSHADGARERMAEELNVTLVIVGEQARSE